MVMPWAVNKCGWRGATGGVRELFLSIGPVTRLLSWPRDRAADHVISVLASGLPDMPRRRQSRARLVDRGVVWLGFSARFEKGYAFQLLPVHFFVPAGGFARLFRPRP